MADVARSERPFGMDPLSEHELPSVSCTVRLTRGEVPPGAPFTLSVEVASSDGRDVSGAKLAITDANGAPVAKLLVVDFDGDVSRTASVQLDAPMAPGSHTWRLEFPEQIVAGVAYAAAHAEVAIEVVPHPIRSNVWGMPEAPIAGTTVRVHVGAKGAQDLALGGRAFEVVDEEGGVVATGTLGSDVAPGTTGLYAAEVSLTTRSEPGIERWTLRVPGFTEPVPHGEARHEFSVRTVTEPDRTVTVRAVDAATRSSIERMNVAMHPFRCSAEGGVATVQVVDGKYTLFVTAPGYEVFRMEVEVAHDLDLDAELHAVVEPDMSENYV